MYDIKSMTKKYDVRIVIQKCDNKYGSAYLCQSLYMYISSPFTLKKKLITISISLISLT